MPDDAPRGTLTERTGRHVCIRCMQEVETEEYLRNDHLCDKCGLDGDYPLASTPEPKRKKTDRR